MRPFNDSRLDINHRRPAERERSSRRDAAGDEVGEERGRFKSSWGAAGVHVKAIDEETEEHSKTFR